MSWEKVGEGLPKSEAKSNMVNWEYIIIAQEEGSMLHIQEEMKSFYPPFQTQNG